MVDLCSCQSESKTNYSKGKETEKRHYYKSSVPALDQATAPYNSRFLVTNQADAVGGSTWANLAIRQRHPTPRTFCHKIFCPKSHKILEGGHIAPTPEFWWTFPQLFFHISLAYLGGHYSLTPVNFPPCDFDHFTPYFGQLSPLRLTLLPPVKWLLSPFSIISKITILSVFHKLLRSKELWIK